MTNVKLAKLPDIFGLPVKKMVGDLDYSKMRHSETPLTDKELGYCEHDCLVVYEYIKMELNTYNTVDKIPITSTGKVRKELQKLVMRDMKYRRIVRDSINTRPSVYNMLVEAFAGGYTHANYMWSDEVISNVDSYDETSAYPYVLVTHRFPSKIFTEARINSLEQMSDRYAYLIRVTFYNIRCKYYNNFISASKCNNITGYRLDNGRVIRADELSITLTDVDFRFICDTYDYDSYTITQCFESLYNYLPDKYINFILDKYVNKTKFKGVKGKEIEYALEKGKFNSIFGMTVTKMIRDEVSYSNEDGWIEQPLNDTRIFEKLMEEQRKSFLSFAWGVWCTETGWTQAWISNTLSMKVLETNVWDYTQNSSIENSFEDTAVLMLNYDPNELYKAVEGSFTPSGRLIAEWNLQVLLSLTLYIIALLIFFIFILL
jgi:hypothetical protein